MTPQVPTPKELDDRKIRVIRLPDEVAREVWGAMLDWHDTLVDDQHDGADNGDAIDRLEEAMHGFAEAVPGLRGEQA